MTELKTIVIKKSKWRRGGATNYKNGKTKLLNEQGFKCCLGFAARQLGYKGKLLDMTHPSNTKCVIDKLTYRYDNAIFNTKFAIMAANTNDDECISDEERMTKLNKLARKAGLKFVFVD